MSSKTTVYGFLELDPTFGRENRRAFDEFPFDEKYPFPNIFGPEVTGYESSAVSFAGIFKSLLEDWEDWELRFDQLLNSLYCRSATVRFVDDVDGELVIRYVCDDGWNSDIEPSKRRWGKWRTNLEGVEVEENHLRRS